MWLRRLLLGYDPKQMQDILFWQMRLIERQQDIILATLSGKDNEKVTALTKRLAAVRKKLQEAVASANDGVVND